MNKDILLALMLATVFATHSKEEWKSRTIYQLLTDRFARSDNNNEACKNLTEYCGGTFRGIIDNLDYIHEMGFDAIWISPVVDNTDKGYHGYWTRDWTKINSHFGSEQDLKDLVEACHKKDMWVMVDVVANHVGDVGDDYTKIYPFNKAEHYHEPCVIENEDWNTSQWKVENCRLAGLPDLKQEDKWVADTLCNWVKDLMQKYNFDGVRVDTVPEVPKWFWLRYKDCVGAFTLGEVFNERIDYVGGYIGPIDSVLNYPIFWELNITFKRGSFMNLVNKINEITRAYGNEQNYMGVFVNNHDNVRFLHGYKNQDNFIGALIFSLFYPGIPIVYYGDEQACDGGKDPNNRESLWDKMNRNSKIYQVLKKAINVRKTHKVWDHPYKELWHTDTMLAFTRGEVLIVLTNSEKGLNMEIPNVLFPNGSEICNALGTECTTVSNGKVHIKLGGNQTGVFVKKAN